MSERKTVQQQQLERLTQLAQTLQDFGTHDPKWADELYEEARGIMISAAPTAFHTQWYRILNAHLAAQSECIRVIAKRGIGQEELTEEEEELYQKAIQP